METNPINEQTVGTTATEGVGATPETAPETKPTLPPKKTKASFIDDTPKAKFLGLLRTVVILLVSSFLITFSSYSLTEPNGFTIGGAAGIAIMVAYKTGGAIPQSLVVFCINAPLVILSYFFVKRKFAILTTANILLQTIWLFAFEQFNAPKIEFESNMRIFAAIATAICFGVGIALAFKIGGSSGGADIAAVIIQKKFPASSIAWMIFIVNAAIIGSSFFVYYTEVQNATFGQEIAHNLLPIMLSLFEAYIESKTNDSVTNGFQSAIEFRIITDKPEEMSHALMTELGRGVTAVPAKGMYTGKEHSMVICVINRRQVMTLRRIMSKIDPDAFAVMTNVSQVLGLGFYSSEQ